MSLGQPSFASQMSQQSVSSQATPNDDDDFHSSFTPSVIVKGPKEDSSMSASSSLHDFDTHEEPKITTSFLTSNASPIVQVETNDDASSRNNTTNIVVVL